MNPALFAAIGFCILFALQTVIQQRYVVSAIHPLQLIFLANTTSFIILTIYSVLFSKSVFTLPKDKKTWCLFFIVTGCWIVADISSIFGLQLSSSVNFSLLSRLQIFITYFGAILFLGESRSAQKLVAIMLAFVGSIIVVYKGAIGNMINLGDMLFLVFTISISISGLARQKLGAYMSALQMSYFMYASSVVVLSIATSVIAPLTTFVIPGYIFGISLLGLLGFLCVNYAIARGGAMLFSVASNLLPVFTALFSFALLQMLPTPSQVMGGVIIIGSIFLFNKARK